jgi:glycosyltransferase involved in cell wall biosynthesis
VALMRIGIDASCWWNRRGFGRFTRGLLPAMFAASYDHRYYLFVDQSREPEMIHANVTCVEVHVARSVTKSAVAHDHRSLRDVYSFNRAVASTTLDVMFFPAVYSWFPVPRRMPTVVTLHDAIAEHFPRLVFANWSGRLLWSLKMRLACQRATGIITVSHTAKREIVDYIGLKPERIDVICEGVDPCFHPITVDAMRAAARRRAGIPADGRLVLYVGGIAPHKNLVNLLAGFAGIASGVPDLRLVFVGDPAGDGFYSNYQDLLARANSHAVLMGRVHFTGFVADEDLAALYSDALALVLPSLSEGFGLPALEAISCGTPVLASRSGAVAEVIGAAGLTFDPHNPSEIGHQICQLANEPTTLSTLRRRAVERAREYTWSKAADLTLRSLERCASTS